MPRDAALVVTRGGHGTLVRAFAAGVPAVVLRTGRTMVTAVG